MPRLCEAIVANQTPYVDTVADCDVPVIGMGASGATGNNVSGMSVAARPQHRQARWRPARGGLSPPDQLCASRGKPECLRVASKSFRPLQIGASGLNLTPFGLSALTNHLKINCK